ncbi:MAG: phosphoglucosamine mutase [Miltoncostaeaceae bacterium]|nr:phosphoglucosamine mutase [Miltoncostaeaceae bacterium]
MGGGRSGRALFGTDGVRGVANRDLTPELALALGRAVGSRLAPGARVLVGRDTRLSGPMLEAALAAGLASAGVEVLLGGVLPTPAIAELVGAAGAAAGAVISASHNPFPDNGIKLFGPDGFKLPDGEEELVERAMEEAGPRPEGAGLGHVASWPEGRARYLDSLLERLPVDLSGMRLAVDCANGATAVTAPEALRRLGAEVDVLAAEPDGVNINDGCGSTHLTSIAAAVQAGGHDLGLAFDGDGDRVLAVDGQGRPVDGDQILAICALAMRRAGTLANDAVVTTTMTNLGFRRAMKAAGITVRWTDVGDRYVLAEMRARGDVLGGEQSGHVINLLHGPTGDGLAAAIQLLGALRETGETLAEAGAIVVRSPQLLLNIRVADRTALAGATAVWDEVTAFEDELGEEGRVVVRASGTEPLVRVMVEAPEAGSCEHWARRIAAVVERELGAGPPA